jgi:hypothetical protein
MESASTRNAPSVNPIDNAPITDAISEFAGKGAGKPFDIVMLARVYLQLCKASHKLPRQWIISIGKKAAAFDDSTTSNIRSDLAPVHAFARGELLLSFRYSFKQISLIQKLNII